MTTTGTDDKAAAARARVSALALLPAIVAALSAALAVGFGYVSWRSAKSETIAALEAIDSQTANVLDVQLSHLVKDMSLAASDPDLARDGRRAIDALRIVSRWRSLRLGFFSAQGAVMDVDFEQAIAALPPEERRVLIEMAGQANHPTMSHPFGDPENRSLMLVVPPPANAPDGRFAAGVFQVGDFAQWFRDLRPPPGSRLEIIRYSEGEEAEIVLSMRKPRDPKASLYVQAAADVREVAAEQITWRGLGAFDLALATALEPGAQWAIWRGRSGGEMAFVVIAGLFATGASIWVARTVARANARQAEATAELAAREQRLIALGRENARLAAALEASPAGVMITDPNQQGNPIVYVNTAFTHLTGYGRDEALGRTPDLLNASETDAKTVAMLREAASAGRSITVELLNKRKDGSHWWNHVGISPLIGKEGRIDAVVYVKSDLTDHKHYEAELTDAKEQAEIANKAKSEFIAVTGHELRSPLNAIIGFSDLLRREAFGPLGEDSYKTYASDIHDSAAHLLALVNDLLDLSKIESGRMDLDREPVDLNDAIRGALVMVRQRASEEGVQIETLLDEDLPPIDGDARKIKQIALNLLTNAVKFTPAHGVVRVESRAQDGAAAFSVADTGVGIAPDDIEKVLEPYAQARNRLSGREAGTGLGLPLTKRLTELHGGEFLLESVLGEGTVATVSIPISNDA